MVSKAQQILSALLEGKFKDADVLYKANVSELTPDEQAWISAYSSYWRGNLKPSPATWWGASLCRIIQASWLSRKLLCTVIVASGVVLKSLGLRSRMRAYFRQTIVPWLIHDRYGNFTQLTAQGYLWKYLAVDEDPMWRYFIDGSLSHGLCCNGRYDLGLPLFRKAEAGLRRLNDERNSTSLASIETFGIYMEYLAGLVYQLDSAGCRDEARALRDHFFEQTKRHGVFWSEIFIRSMRIITSIDMLDESLLIEDARRIQDLLGSSYNDKFGLRIAVSKAYLAALSGDSVRSRQELINAEYYYQINQSPIELYRYHQIRAQMDLLDRNLQSCKYHTERAIGFITGLPGAIFHKSDAELNYCETLLGTMLWSPGTDSTIDMVRRKLKSIRRSVIGSDLVTAKVDVLERTIDYLMHRFERVADKDLKQRINKVSVRMGLFYDALCLNWIGKDDANVSLENQAVLREKSVLSLLNTAAGRQEIGLEHAEAVRAIFLAETCEQVGIVKLEDEETAEFRLKQVDDRETLLTITTNGREGMRFRLTGSRTDIKFDRAAAEYLHLACTIVRECEARRELLAASMNSVIAKTTQMLAHDVRKPFSILRMGLGMLGGAKDPTEIKSVVTRLIPEIDKAISSVDGLIADVMEVGSTSNELIQEAANPEALIEATLGEAFRIYPKSDIAITYDFKHTHMVNVHPQKVGRVFSNIVGNAVQAINQTGKIWFKTREEGGFVEFCIGNAGSFISPESLPKLFDAFFTRGKKGGTGLGLAICQKVVAAHGGRIWCESSKSIEYLNGKVEFFFTLPIAEGVLTNTTANLPDHSSVITNALLALIDAAPSGGSVDKSELTLESDIVRARMTIERPLRVLVVDDEGVYRNALATYLSRTPDLSRMIEVVQSKGSTDAFTALDKESFDVVITDVDMGANSLDGFAFVKELRRRKSDALICVHSNRVNTADYKTAMQVGADAFLPKPMARMHLLKLILQAAKAQASVALAPSAKVSHQSDNKPEILVVDDNPFILGAWEDALRGEAKAHVFSSLEALRETLQADPGFAGRLWVAITDFNLDGSSGDGLDVGRLLKKHCPELRVLLTSDDTLPAATLEGAIDLTIGKNPVGLSALSALPGLASRCSELS